MFQSRGIFSVILWLSTLIGGLGIGLFIGILVGGRRRNHMIKDAITALKDLSKQELPKATLISPKPDIADK